MKLGGENLHYAQCMKVPEKLDQKNVVHPECYKKFACAKTLLKKWKSDDENQSSKQLKTSKNEETIAWSAKGSQLKLMVKNSWLKIF